MAITPPEEIGYCSWAHHGYLDGILGRDPNPRLEGATDYDAGWLQGQEDKNKPEKLQVLEAPAVKKGDTVLIPKGTDIWSTRKGATVKAGRNYKVKLHDVTAHTWARFDSRGSRTHEASFIPPQPARVLWAGTGGYWCEADAHNVTRVEE